MINPDPLTSLSQVNRVKPSYFTSGHLPITVGSIGQFAMFRDILTTSVVPLS